MNTIKRITVETQNGNQLVIEDVHDFTFIFTEADGICISAKGKHSEIDEKFSKEIFDNRTGLGYLSVS